MHALSTDTMLKQFHKVEDFYCINIKYYLNSQRFILGDCFGKMRVHALK